MTCLLTSAGYKHRFPALRRDALGALSFVGSPVQLPIFRVFLKNFPRKVDIDKFLLLEGTAVFLYQVSC